MKKIETSEPLSVSSGVRILGALSLLIAMSALLLLIVQNGYAETPPAGFQPGARTFNNTGSAPGGGDSPPATDFFDDESEYDVDDMGGGYTSQPPAGANAGSGPGFGVPSANSSTPVVRSGKDQTVDIEGASAGVVSTRTTQPLRVDAEGSAGSNEVVTDFNFPDADIMDIAKALGKLTGQNFILDKDVKGRITIISNSPVTVKDAWRAFLTALDMNGFALIPSGKFTRIARQRDARDKQLRTYVGKYAPDSDALITRLFSLKFLSAEEVARNFRSFMPANSRIIPYEQTNTVIVTDTGSNIAKLSKLLDILDVESYDAGIEVIPVKFASAMELSKLIDQLIPGSAPVAAGPRFPGAAARSAFSSRKTKEGGIINTIIADERTNNLIVHANTKGADQVRELVLKLDKKLPATLGGGKVHVIYLQFADAEQIANTLNNLASNSGPAARPAGSAAGTGVNPVQATLFEGNIKVAADKSTNSLVLTATGNDYTTLQRVINRLDIPRDQVYAEVYIMEIGLNKDFAFSASILNPASGLGSVTNGDLANFIANPISATGAIIGFKSGGTKTITANGQNFQIGSIQGLVKFLQTNTNATILATPQILTLDNTEATFESGEKVPVPSAVTSATGVTTGGTTKEDVLISIKLKPAISKLSNFVKLDVEAKLQDFSQRVLPKAVADQAQAILTRTAKTSVVVADGDTVVIGGLVRNVDQETTAKVPFLGDIPVLGWLFKSRTSSAQKSNMLIFITPKIIRQYEAIRTVLDRKLKERDDFLEKAVGGVDLGKDFRDKIIRSLPDLNKLKNTRPQTNFTIDNGPDATMMMEENSGNRAGSSASAPSAPADTDNGMPPSFPPPHPDPFMNPFIPGADLPPPPSGYNGGDQG